MHAKEVLKEAVRVVGIVAAVGGGILDALDRIERHWPKREIDSTRTYDDKYDKQLQQYHDATRCVDDYKGRSTG